MAPWKPGVDGDKSLGRQSEGGRKSWTFLRPTQTPSRQTSSASLLDLKWSLGRLKSCQEQSTTPLCPRPLPIGLSLGCSPILFTQCRHCQRPPSPPAAQAVLRPHLLFGSRDTRELCARNIREAGTHESPPGVRRGHTLPRAGGEVTRLPSAARRAGALLFPSPRGF